MQRLWKRVAPWAWLWVASFWVILQYGLWTTLEHHDIPTHKQIMQQEFSVSALSVTNKTDMISKKLTDNLQVSAVKHPSQAQYPDITSDDNFQIVFSTDCSGYQHWQGILLYYSAMRVQQPGVITRIASGCTPELEMKIQQEWTKLDPSGKKFRVHFAPSTSLDHAKYKYSNKPGGLWHWLQHGRPSLTNDTVVCLLDPDMILLRPITSQLVDPQWKVESHGRNQIQYVDQQGIPRLLRVTSLDGTNLPAHVMTGNPAGQHFGIGGAWVQGKEPHARPVWQNFSKAAVCGVGSKCTTTLPSDADEKYAVGPVYLATVQDWHSIAKTWSHFVPTVHQQYPHLLAEMYAMTMAVADLELPFSLFSSYMITGSEVGSPTEAWSWIDDWIGRNGKTAKEICQEADTSQPPVYEWSARALPNVLHYCQRYKLDANDKEFLFSKRKIPHDVFSCDVSKAIPFDIQDLLQSTILDKSTLQSKTSRRTLFAFCHAVPILNWARQEYQQQVCQQQT